MDETIEIFTAGEDLNRASPELWPELMPGVERFTSLMTSPEEQSKQENQRRSDEVKEKRKAELRGLTEQQLIAQIKLLKERAYRIGLEEAREVERGKMLNIFGDFKHQIP